MAELAHSKIRTEHSFIDNVSIHDALPPNDLPERLQELHHLYRWAHLAIRTRAVGPPTLPSSPQRPTFFMFKLDSLHALPFRRVQQHSKVYAHLTAFLLHRHSGLKVPKTVRTVKLLEETNAGLFELKESLHYYCYSSREAELLVEIQICLSEELSNPNDPEVKPVHSCPESVGVVTIELEKEVKSKEKRAVCPLGWGGPLDRTRGEPKGACCVFLLVRSEAYKYLQWLVPPDTLCDGNDRVPGVMGGALPMNENTLSDFAITPEAQGMLLQAGHFEVSGSLLKEAEGRCHLYARHTLGVASEVTCNLREHVLRASFHNGWKAVSQGETLLRERENQLLPANQSTSGMHRHPSKESLDKRRGNKTAPLEKRYFEAEKGIDLGLVFPGEEECVLVLQVLAKFTVAAEFPPGERDSAGRTVKEVMEVPVCFSLLSGVGMTLHRVQTLKVSGGCPLTSQGQLLEMLGGNLAQLQSGQAWLERTSRQRRSALDDLSAMRSVKTTSNLTAASGRREWAEWGSLEFEMHPREKEFIASADNPSLLLDNRSSFNFSKVELKDKINAEKERILKETKRSLQLHKKMGVEFFPRPLLSSHQKAEVLLPIPQPSSTSQAADKQALLRFLQQYLPPGPAKSREREAEAEEEGSQLQVYYSLRGSRGKEGRGWEGVRVPPSFYRLLSNREFPENASFFLYERTPMEVIRTELSELNSNNCFFFNFQAVVAGLHESLFRFPRVFFFRTRFWHHPEVRSQLLTVSKDTGEIVLFGEDQETASKVMHVEIDFDEQADTHHLNFVHFIEYLYNGLLSLELTDYSTGFPFGTFYLPLRSLIRRRRNEVLFLHEDYLYHKSMTRGRLRLEVRTLRKMRQKARQLLPATQQDSLPPQDLPDKQRGERERILQRIERFKETKARRSSPSKGRFEVQLGEEGQEEQCRHIENLFTDKFVSESKILRVSCLKKYFFFLNVQNRQSQPTAYQLSVSDQDGPWIRSNALSSGEEIAVVRDFSLLEARDREIMLSVKKFVEKIDRCCSLTEEGLIRLAPKEKATLLLCYLSVRKYRPQGLEEDPATLPIYNRERTVTCSLANALNGTIEALYNIQVVPLPDESNLELEFYRPAQEQAVIHLPFLENGFLEEGLDQLLVDDPFALVSSAACKPSTDRKVFASRERGSLLELSNGILSQKCKEINVLLVNNTEEKEKMVNLSRRGDKPQLRYPRADMPIPYYGGPPAISLSLRVWGCLKVSAQTDLWVESEFSHQLQTHIFSHPPSTPFFYVFSDNAEVLRAYKDPRMKAEAPDLFKVGRESTSVVVYFRAFPVKVGCSFVHLNVVEAREVVEQEEGGEFREVVPICRMVCCLETRMPPLKEVLKININRAQQQKVIEEPFGYRSSCQKKTGFRVLSSDSALLWVKGADQSFQLEARGERKISILFNLESIVLHSEGGAAGDGVVLGVKWDRGIDYFGFRFNIY